MCVLTFALQLHHGLVPLVLVRLVLRGDGEALGPGVQHDHVLVLGVGPLVDVEARLQRQGFLRDGGLAAEFLLALVVLQAGRAALRGGAEHEVPPVHGLLLAEVAALAHVLAALVLAGLALHGASFKLPRITIIISSFKGKHTQKKRKKTLFSHLFLVFSASFTEGASNIPRLPPPSLPPSLARIQRERGGAHGLASSRGG